MSDTVSQGDQPLYALTVNEKQLAAIMPALELFARLGMGQMDMALDALPLKPGNEMDYSAWHQDIDTVRKLLAKHMIGHVDGHQSFMSMRSEQVKPPQQVAWDLYQVVRHRLSWDRAYAEGVVKPGEPRNFSKMMGVNFDNPMRIGVEPLATIERVETKEKL